MSSQTAALTLKLEKKQTKQKNPTTEQQASNYPHYSWKDDSVSGTRDRWNETIKSWIHLCWVAFAAQTPAANHVLLIFLFSIVGFV